MDLADLELTAELKGSLSGFNVDRRKYRLKHLWVMSRGMLTEIDLKE